MTHDNVTDIVERLMESCPHPRTGAPLFVNPDGPAVVAIIEAQQADLATLRKQLENAREAALEQAARVAEEAPIIGPTLSSWINTNESPMGATRRHIATAIRALKGQP